MPLSALYGPVSLIFFFLGKLPKMCSDTIKGCTTKPAATEPDEGADVGRTLGGINAKTCQEMKKKTVVRCS